MISPKTKQEIDVLREGGRRHAIILHELAQMCVPGVSSFEIEERARALCKKHQVIPAFLNYPGEATYPFPSSICFSVNDEIVHGIPNQSNKILQDGDVVTIDIGIIFNDLITDAAVTVIVGEDKKGYQSMIDAANYGLAAGIGAALVDSPVSDIGCAIEQVIKRHGDYTIYRGLVGHGVGYDLHEEPNIPNFCTKNRRPLIPSGAVLAIEPMIGDGSPKFILDPDEWTYRTVDGSVSVHVEHTIVVLDNGPEILTTIR